MSDLAQHLRFALRSLRRTPSFTIAAIGSLALGFALLALAISVVHAYSIRALPFASAERQYRVRYAPPGPWEPRGVSSLDWDTLSDVVAYPIAAQGDTFYVSEAEGAPPVRGLRVGKGFTDGLGVRVVHGRSLAPSDFQQGSEPTALMGHALWRTRYGAAPAILGRTLRLEPESGTTTDTVRIVGILEPGFYFGRDSTATVDLLLPSTTSMRAYQVRLQDGVPPEMAERRITEAVRRVARDLPPDWDGAHLNSVHDLYVAELRPVFSGITIASSLVLVLVCANVAVLIVLRQLRRQKEIAIRTALGGSRWDLTRMLLLETFALCAAGCALGVGIATAALPPLASNIEQQLGRPAPGGAGAIGVDTTVLVILAGAALVIAALLSLLPVLVPIRRMGELLRTTGTSGAESRRARAMRSGLIALEVAGALVLLVSCGLMVRSVMAMLHTDLGFDADRLARGRIVLRAAGYPDAAAFSRFYDQFAARVSAETGASIAFSSWPPFAEFPTQLVEADGRSGDGASAGAVQVGPGYFTTLGITLRSGRDFTAADVTSLPAEAGSVLPAKAGSYKGEEYGTEESVEPVAIVSETLARQLWPDGSAIGRLVRPVEPTPDGPRRGEWRRVVGVASDVRQAYDDTNLRDIYTPQIPPGRFGMFYVRTDLPQHRLWEAMKRVAAGLDPRATVGELRAVRSQDTQRAGTSFLAGLLAALALVAAFIAVVGIYGVTAFASQQREREIAIRMALGATGSRIVRLFLRESSVVIATGLLAGLAGAASASRLLQSQLYGVSALDAATLAATSLLLGGAGVLAALWPAKRASSRSPLAGLKEG